MIVRPLREADLGPVLELWREARHLPAHVTHTAEEDRAFLLTLHDVRVAERDGTRVGFMALSPGWIEHLAVAVAAQRTGVGSALIAHAKERMDEIRLHTHAANEAARAFYAAHGFVEIAHGTAPPPENVPDVLLRWSRERPASA